MISASDRASNFTLLHRLHQLQQEIATRILGDAPANIAGARPQHLGCFGFGCSCSLEVNVCRSSSAICSNSWQCRRFRTKMKKSEWKMNTSGSGKILKSQLRQFLCKILVSLVTVALEVLPWGSCEAVLCRGKSLDMTLPSRFRLQAPRNSTTFWATDGASLKLLEVWHNRLQQESAKQQACTGPCECVLCPYAC